MSNQQTKFTVTVPTDNEIEVFRCEPIPGKYYEHAEATRKTGDWRTERCFATHATYVGQFIRCMRWGYGDNGGCAAFFDLDGVSVRVDYSYEGNTCFREVPELSPQRLWNRRKHVMLFVENERNHVEETSQEQEQEHTVDTFGINYLWNESILKNILSYM